MPFLRHFSCDTPCHSVFDLASRALQLENLFLRHQIGVLHRSARKRPKLTSLDRRLCRTNRWFHSARVPGPCDRVPLELATPNLGLLFPVLSPIENASVVGEDPPEPRSIQPAEMGRVVTVPQVGGLRGPRKILETVDKLSEKPIRFGPDDIFVRHNLERSLGTPSWYVPKAIPNSLPAGTPHARRDYPMQSTRIFALLTFFHDASVERLNGPDIVWIKLRERVDLLFRDVHWSLQHKPRDALTAGRSR